MTPKPCSLEADPRWARVVARDASADGRFFVAIRTTGIFCKPSCPSRPAKPANVVLFDTAAQAEAAGFRACLRCRPLAAEGRDPLAARVEAVAAHIRTHADQTLTLNALAAFAQISPFHLQRSFTAILGVSPKAYQAAERLHQFKRHLRAGSDVLAATFEAGYGSTSRSYDQIDGGLGMTPSAYRAGGADTAIVHAIRKTALGLLMMAATDRGVCFVQFGDTEAALNAALHSAFPNAALTPSPGGAPLDNWAAALDTYLAQGGPHPDLPLELRGTAFQIRVWRFLLSVKPGHTVSYSDIAANIGAPKAARAVGSACGANIIAILIPCHRALRGDGAPGGYRWGLDRKRALLGRERCGVGVGA
jgi:AraC family transcriptional regulator of adaptative response/methylated-DNA-[protein]-cysteine methyltransferase